MGSKSVAVFLILAVFGLKACSFAPKTIPDLDQYQVAGHFLSADFGVTEDSVLIDRWWESFGDDSLNALVSSTIRNNLDLRLALSRIQQFEALFRISRGARLPQVTATGSAAKSESPIFLPAQFSQGQGGGPLINEVTQYNLNTGFRFEIDVWGKFRNLEKAAIADLMISKADLQTVYLGLVAQVASLYFEIKALAQRRQLTAQIVETYEKDLSIQEWRYQNGIGSQLAVELTRQALAATRARLAQESEGLAASYHQLSVLIGGYPDQSIGARIDTAGGAPDFEAVPVGLPSELLKRRSDIRSAELGLEKARQLIGAARADFFPSISLTGSLGYLTDDYKDLFSADFLTKNLSVSGTQTLFSGGMKKGALNQRWAQYEAAELTYKKVVLEAFREVEDALVQIKSVDLQHEALLDQRAASRHTFRLRDDRYLKGIGEFDKVLEARRNFFNAEAGLITAKKNLALSRIRLHKALGGAWVDEKAIAGND